MAARVRRRPVACARIGTPRPRTHILTPAVRLSITIPIIAEILEECYFSRGATPQTHFKGGSIAIRRRPPHAYKATVWVLAKSVPRNVG